MKGEKKIIYEKIINKGAFLASLFKWLSLNDGVFETRKQWKKAITKKIDELLYEDSNK